MKSIVFTVERLWELLLNGSKDQTIRLIFIPAYFVGDKINIIARRKINGIHEDKILFVASITEIFPIQMGDITEEMAKRDGFDTIDECKRKLAEINNKDLERFDETWGFVTRFKKTNEAFKITVLQTRLIYEKLI